MDKILSNVKLFRGEIWHIIQKLSPTGLPVPTLKCFEHGALAVNANGFIEAVGAFSEVKKRFAQASVVNLEGHLILPGFIDPHLHFPQLDIIGCYGEKLLRWLERYTFKEETQFSNPSLSKETSCRFITELFAHGITSSMVFAATFFSSADLLFKEALHRGCRMIVGKVSMDRNAPERLLQGAEEDFDDNQALIKKWHGKEGRLYCALTPRFAPACSKRLLSKLQELKSCFPDLYVQTHHSETLEEVKWVKKLFPGFPDYLSIYERYGFLGPRTVLAHSIHATESEIRRIAETKTKVVHCPTSNLFLGSGLFPLNRFAKRKASVSLGSDIGGGTSLSPWTTMNEAYKIQQLLKENITPESLFYMSTLGAATSIDMAHLIGNFEKGKAADFQVLNIGKHRLLSRRFKTVESAKERLFAMMMMADDRIVEEVFIQGRSVYRA